MANYSNLKAAIADVIKTNGTKAITGQVLQDVLNSIVSVIGANYQFAGVATPATNPGTPDQNVFYIAMQGGTYTNFNATALPEGISLLMWNGSWSSQVISYNDGGVFDISVYKSTGGTLATFADLAAALGTNGANIPQNLRRGGMSVKFVQSSVQSSDNKYVQYRLMSDSFNTTPANWQGVDDEPTAGSDNLVKSGGVKSYADNLPAIKIALPSIQTGLYATGSGNPPRKAMSHQQNSQCLDITNIDNDLYKIKHFWLKTRRVSSSLNEILYFCTNGFITSYRLLEDADEFSGIITVPDGVDNIAINSALGYDIEFIPVYYKEIEYIKEALVSIKEEDEFLPATQTGYTTGSGNPPKIHISNQSNSIYAKIAAPSGSKLYITSKRYSSSLNEFVYFADKNNTIISYLTFNEEYETDREVTVPAGTSSIYINGVSGYDIKVRIHGGENIVDLCERVESLEKRIPQISGVKTINESVLNSFAGVSAIRFYGDLPYITSQLTEFGYDNSTNKFYIGVNGMQGVKDYTARPTGGYAVNKDTISFILNPPSEVDFFYYIEVDIDWIAYNAANAQYIDLSSYTVYLDCLYLRQLDSIKGDIDLYSDKILKINSPLRGSLCNIKVHSVSSTLLLQNDGSIENITFTDVTANAITREEYSAEEIAEKPVRTEQLKPIISESDLSSEQAATFNGDNSYGFIRFASTTINSYVIGCTFNNFNRIVLIDSVTRHKDIYHNVVANNMFNSCRTAMYCYSEFTRINSNYFYGCIFGIVINCSNFNAVNCNMVRCDCGIYFTSAQNSHGEISTFELAHNNVAGVYAKVITNECGFIFTNCQFAQAMIIAEVAYGLKFTSCRMDSYVRIDSGAKNSVIGCNCGMAYVTPEGYNELFNVPSDTLLALNRAYLASDDDSNYNN